MPRTKTSFPRLTAEELSTGGWLTVAAYARKTGYTGVAVRNWIGKKLDAREHRGIIVVRPLAQE